MISDIGVFYVNLKKLIASTMIVTVGALGLPLMASAEDVNTAVVGNNVYVVSDASTKAEAAAKKQNTTGEKYVGLRQSLTAAGINVEWVASPSKLLTLSLGGTTVQVPIDEANALLGTQGDSFSYKVENGTMQAPVAFFEYILDNATVSYNAKTGLVAITATDATKSISFKNLDAYQGSVNADENNSGNSNSTTGGETYTYYQSGQATWYGAAVQGNLTASGEVFDMYGYTCAHNSLPFGTKIRVTDVDTGLSVIVRVTDRGGFGGSRVVDLSWQAASDLGMISKGVANVTIEIVE